MIDTSRLARGGLSVAVGVWAFLFVAFFGTALPAFDAGIRVIAMLLYALPLVAWAVLRLRGPRDVLDIAVLIGLGLSLVVSVTSAGPTGSLEALGMTLGFTLLFWAARAAAERPWVRSGAVVGVSAALILWLLIAASTWVGEKVAWMTAGGGLPPLESSRILGWSSPNTFPVLVLLATPFILAIRPPLIRRAALVLYVASAAVVVPFSVGRAGYAGIAAALVAYELLRGGPFLRRLWAPAQTRRLVLASACVVLLGVGVLLVAVGARVAEAVLVSRVRIWEQALSIFAADPITGGGPSTFHWLRLQHAPDYGDRIPVYLAHNVVIQTLADGGLLLTAALATVVVAFGWVVARRRAWRDPWARLTLAVLVGYAAASLFDDFSTFPAVTAMVVVLAGAVAGEPVGALVAAAPRDAPRRWLAPALLAALVLVSVPAVVAVAGARLAAEEGRAMALRADWAGAETAFERAAESHPLNAGYHLGLGLARANQGDDDGARQAYAEAQALSPGDPRAHGALAALTDAPPERARLLDLAARRTIRDPQYAFRLGTARSLLGDTSAAIEAFALALAIEPRLFGALPDGADPAAVAAGVPAVLDMFEEQRDVIGLEAAWDAGLALGDLPPAAPIAWQAVARAASGSGEAAQREADRAVELAPHDPRAYQALAFAAAVACDESAIERARRLLTLLARPGIDEVPGGSPISEGWDPAYREEGLGDYQPAGAVELPDLEPWPVALVGAPPACG